MFSDTKQALAQVAAQARPPTRTLRLCSRADRLAIPCARAHAQTLLALVDYEYPLRSAAAAATAPAAPTAADASAGQASMDEPAERCAPPLARV
jgi:hypothetical protein